MRNSQYPTQRYCLCSSYNRNNPTTGKSYPMIGIEIATSGKVRLYSQSDENSVTDNQIGTAPEFDV